MLSHVIFQESETQSFDNKVKISHYYLLKILMIIVIQDESAVGHLIKVWGVVFLIRYLGGYFFFNLAVFLKGYMH